ncbi:hypothetical protein [Saccharolobus solfataricus]|nr:hypothetical protein [Saccharolobus solfataricus]
MKVITLFLFLFIILIPIVNAGYDYGYEFGYVNMNGIQAIVTLYNISLQPGSPPISIQQNVCLNLNGSEILVQNVIIPLILTATNQYEINWVNSVFYNGSYHTFSYSFVVGNTFNLTTVWVNSSDKLVITFYLSNCSTSLNRTYVLYGNYIGVVYSGYDAGTVIVGFRNGATADFVKGFNVSIQEFYRYDNSWYVPPVAYSGYSNTGESATNGYAYFYDGKVWVIYGNASTQMLYNFSVIIVNNTIFTFPKGSLWLSDGNFFTDSIPLKGNLIISPFYYFNYSFSTKKQILLKFNNYTVVDGIKGKAFYLPSSENVYIRENGKCVMEFINQSNVNQREGANPMKLLFVIVVIIAGILSLLYYKMIRK